QADPSAKPEVDDEEQPEEPPESTTNEASVPAPTKPRRQAYAPDQMSATSNTLSVIHSNQQPNLSLLRYFNFDSNNPTTSHPLYTHLKTLSWLQLLDPTSDSTYTEPPLLTPEQLSKLKSNPRSNYYRKRRRWARARAVIDDTRLGGFDGLVVASHTDPTSILARLVPLLSGGAQVVVYAPHVEPLLALTDHYSTARRSAFLNLEEDDERRVVPSEDFPVDPTLLLAPAVQTSRVRAWQVLPGRTHPVMTSKGGAEGYVWTATRVVRAEGRVAARGKGRRNIRNKLPGKEGGGGVGGEDAVLLNEEGGSESGREVTAVLGVEDSGRGEEDGEEQQDAKRARLEQV
ncbi:MAG: hypothetical protein INR71_09245, partial [Terriglobus roseus]|nr:hypothetical protein [Terriglobus roseus]